MIRPDFIAAARALKDVPFRHQGRDPVLGVDCLGLCVLALRAIGMNPPDRTDYPRQPTGELRKALDAWMVPVDTEAEADVCLIALAGVEMHVGILTDQGLLHAYSPLGRVVEHPIDARWRRRMVAFYGLPEPD